MKNILNKWMFVPAIGAVMAMGACNNADWEKTKTGLLYQVYPSKSGTALKPGNIVKMSMEVKLGDSVLYSTVGHVPAFDQVDSVGRPHDFSEVLSKLKEGDSVVTVQFVDSLAKSGGLPPQFKKGDKIKSFIKILKVMPTMELGMAEYEKEQQMEIERSIASVETFLKEKNIKAVKQPKGSFVEIIQPGTGATADSGMVISVRYKGLNFAGKMFDTNTDLMNGVPKPPLDVTIGNGGVIPGFEEGLKALNKGAKANLYIPSMLGYGPRAAGENLKAYENLKFEIEVLDVRPAKAGAAAPTMPGNTPQ